MEPGKAQGVADAAKVASLIARGAQSGPWLVIGASGDHVDLAEGLKSSQRFEHVE